MILLETRQKELLVLGLLIDFLCLSGIILHLIFPYDFGILIVSLSVLVIVGSPITLYAIFNKKISPINLGHVKMMIFFFAV